MKLLDIEQRTKEWHDFRKGGIGSSDITVLLGSYPFGDETPLTLFEDKTSHLISHEDNTAMAHGREEEPKAFAELLKMNSTLRPACAIHDEHEFMRCSFDALGNDTFYEIKCPMSLRTLEKSLMGDLQQYWKDQARWQLMIASHLKLGHIAVWDTNSNHIFPIERDLEWESNAMKVAQEFWNKVLTGERPDPQEADYLVVEDQECSDFLRKYYQLSEQEKEIEKQKELLKTHILDKGPGRNFMVGGVKIYQDQRTSYDINKMRADGINVEVYKKLSNPFWKISPKKGSSRAR